MDNNGFKTVEEGAKACLDNKADIVVICSSDDEYATIAPEVYAALKDKATIVVAGNRKPISLEESVSELCSREM